MLKRLWRYTTRKLLKNEWIGTHAGFTVLKNDSIEKEELVDTLDLPAFKPPIKELESLEDTPGKVYVWRVDSEYKRERFLKALEQYQNQRKELDALHIVLTDSEELHRLDSDELKPYLD